ncbi:hypothetical protein ACFQZX_03885 [Mucilaginibacter litoreus]|uniref:Uncharacterized protein n=1 Tax=Mucilaginibacter litoreus TaxID=1048221 RepID=A0ABW3AP41_9SPHI
MCEIEKNLLYLKNAEPIVFEHDIKDALVINGVIVVLLNIPPQARNNLNVYAFDVNGDFFWRIKPTDLYQKSKDCPYIGIAKLRDNTITLTNWCDTVITVDIISGDIVEKHHVK